MPQLLFLDVTHAPRSGWSAAETSKGAAITVWGRGFGATRGANHISVGGVDLTSAADYEVWNGDAQLGLCDIQYITFYLNSSVPLGDQEITVTVGGETSQALTVNVNEGSIIFVDKDHGSAGTGTLTDPHQNLEDAFDGIAGGDVIYVREAATPYTTVVNSSDNVWRILFNASKTARCSLVGYPGESPEVNGIPGEGGPDVKQVVSMSGTYWNLSRFILRAQGAAIACAAKGTRAIGNDCVGCTKYYAGTAIITSQSGEIDWFGNRAHGATTDNRLDHATYIAGDPSGCDYGVDEGWNYCFDNLIDRGPILSINHQDERIPNGRKCPKHRIHHNHVDGTDHPSVAFYVNQLSYNADYPGEPIPDHIEVWNNLFIDCGYDYGDGATSFACNHVNGPARVFNNTFANSVAGAFQLSDGIQRLDSAWYNNIFVCNISSEATGQLYARPYGTGGASDADNENPMRISRNLFYGLPKSTIQDDIALSLRGNPVFTNEAGGDYSLGTASPAIGRGISPAEVIALVVDDFIGNPRTPGRWDLGAFAATSLSAYTKSYNKLGRDAIVYLNGDANGDDFGDVNDASGSGNNGAWTGSASYGTGFFPSVFGGGKSIVTGSTSKVSISVGSSSAMTVAMRIKMDAPAPGAGYNGVLELAGGASTFRLEANENGNCRLTSGSTTNFLSGFLDGESHVLIAVDDGTQTDVFLDQQLLVTTASNGAFTSAVLSLGASSDGHDVEFSEVMCTDSAWTEEDRQNYINGAEPDIDIGEVPTLTISSTSWSATAPTINNRSNGTLKYYWELRDADDDSVVDISTEANGRGHGSFSGNYYVLLRASNDAGWDSNFDRQSVSTAVSGSADVATPTLLLAEVAEDGDSIVATFDEAVTSDGTGFTLSGLDGSCTLSLSSGSGSTQLVLGTSRTIGKHEYQPNFQGLLAYDSGTGNVSDGTNALASFSGVEILNRSSVDIVKPVIVPEFTGINSTGTLLSVKLNKDAGSGQAGFSLDGPRTITLTPNGVTQQVLTYTLDPAILVGEEYLLDYAAGDVADLSGNALGSFTGQAITNDSIASNDISYNKIFGHGQSSQDSSLVSNWMFTETTGTTIADEAGTGVLTLINMADPLDKEAGPRAWLPNALSFDGNNDYAQFPGSIPYRNKDAISVGLWVKADSFPGAVSSIWLHGVTGSPLFIRRKTLTSTNSIANSIEVELTPQGGSIISFDWETPNAWNDSDWHLLGFTYVRGEFAKLWWDGIEVASTSVPDLPTSGNSGAIRIQSGASASAWPGAVSQHFFLERALTADEWPEVFNGVEPESLTAPPAPSGTAAVGEELATAPGTYQIPVFFTGLSNGTVSHRYQWYRADDNTGTNEEAITSASDATYTVQAADASKFLRYSWVPENDGGFSPDEIRYSAYVEVGGNALPTVSSITVAANGTTVTGVFSEPVTAGEAEWDGLTVNDMPCVYVSGDGTDTIVFEAVSTIYSGTVTADYLQVGDGIQDLLGADLETFSDQAVTNNSEQTEPNPAPTISSITLAANGTTVTVVLSEAVTVGADGWSGLVVDGKVCTYESGDTTDTIVFEAASVIYSGTITAAYTQPGDGIQDLLGELLASFTGQSVTNNSEQSEPVVIVIYQNPILVKV